MLIDLKFNPNPDEFIPHPENSENEFAFYFNSESERFKGLVEPETLSAYIKKHEIGVYESNGHNFDSLIESFTDYQPILRPWSKFMGPNGSAVNITEIGEVKVLFGVADNVEQIKEYFAPAINNPDVEFVIGLCEVRKENEPKSGGWRWHKWGTYQGNKNPQCEYIADEPEIESVFCFHGYYIEKSTK